MIKNLAIAGGVSLLAATAHVTISKTTGYQDAHAGLVLAIAAGAGVGAWALSAAWDEGRRLLAVFLALAMLSGELFGLSQTADRIAAEREKSQAPARVQLEAHKRAVARVEAATGALEALASTSPRLSAAVAAKAAADQAAIDKSAERGCASNCRALLEQQVANAEAETAAARAERQEQRSLAETELAAARTALDNTPPPKASGTPLADRLNIDAANLDMIIAAFGALGANGLAACLIAFGAHGRREATTIALSPQEPSSAAVDLPKPASAQRKRLPGPSSAREHAAEFSVTCLRASPDTDTPLARLHSRYRQWCQENARKGLPASDLARELAGLFGEYGVPIEAVDGQMVIRGVALAE